MAIVEHGPDLEKKDSRGRRVQPDMTNVSNENIRPVGLSVSIYNKNKIEGLTRTKGSPGGDMVYTGGSPDQYYISEPSEGTEVLHKYNPSIHFDLQLNLVSREVTISPAGPGMSIPVIHLYGPNLSREITDARPFVLASAQEQIAGITTDQLRAQEFRRRNHMLPWGNMRLW